MSRPKDQQRFEVWISRYERERLDVLAHTHNVTRSAVVRAAFKALFMTSGMDLPDMSPTTREAMERHLDKIEGRG